MTTITTFATAVDVTIAELKLEAFLPADQATTAILTSRHADRQTGGVVAPHRPPSTRREVGLAT
jgi:hypothetical protein